FAGLGVSISAQSDAVLPQFSGAFLGDLERIFGIPRFSSRIFARFSTRIAIHIFRGPSARPPDHQRSEDQTAMIHFSHLIRSADPLRLRPASWSSTWPQVKGSTC